MALLRLLTLIFVFVNHILGATVKISNLTARNHTTDDAPSSGAEGHHEPPWLICNTPPRYNILLAHQQCQQVYDRFIDNPKNFQKLGWHGINTPSSLTEETDTCVMRVETNHRDQSDEFRMATLAYVGLSISRQCILGGAASIGTKGFYVSVTGMVPAKELGNSTTDVPSVSTA